ncbi:MAG: PilT/PilU family type 4a pilus ATPase [Rhodocyclaceae bacterium]|nr:PilT/PilU family type 4a pilus ATPase [Rhodocyclaceae bacterium]
MLKLFQLMAEKGASDIYASVGAPINIKINGVAMPINQQVVDTNIIMGLLREMLTPEQLSEYQQTCELNTARPIPGVGNFRISVMRQKGTPAFVVRYIPAEIPKFETLNLPPILLDVIQEKRGLFLVVGATGSGKSTTLASLIEHRNERQTGHILTLEDPIEFIFTNKKSIINQREIGIDTRDYHTALRNALRQAPDVIFIGEIRDMETMSHAIAYAQSGHLVLATLHANNSYHSLARIISFYPLENRPALLADLSVTLRAISAQRLVTKPDGSRTPACEVMLNTRLVSDLIAKGDLDGIKEAMEQSLTPGSQTFEQSLYRLYKDNVITLDEALAYADSPNNLHWLIENAGAPPTSKEREKTSGPLVPPMATTTTNESGTSFAEFTLTIE